QSVAIAFSWRISGAATRRPRRIKPRQAFAASTLDLLERRLDAALALHPCRDRQPLRAQERRIEELRLVARPVVCEHRHDGVARPQFLGEADGARNVDAGRAAETKAFVL